MLIGWAWGAAMMAAGLSARSHALLAKQQQNAQASYVLSLVLPQELDEEFFQACARHSSCPSISKVYLRREVLGSTVPVTYVLSVYNFLRIWCSTTGVYAVFFFIGTFALGALRAYVPKLALTSIFGTIVLDVVRT